MRKKISMRVMKGYLLLLQPVPNNSAPIILIGTILEQKSQKQTLPILRTQSLVQIYSSYLSLNA